MGEGSCACVIGNGANHTRAIASVSEVAVADLEKFIVLPLSMVDPASPGPKDH